MLRSIVIILVFTYLLIISLNAAPQVPKYDITPKDKCINGNENEEEVQVRITWANSIKDINQHEWKPKKEGSSININLDVDTSNFDAESGYFTFQAKKGVYNIDLTIVYSYKENTTSRTQSLRFVAGYIKNIVLTDGKDYMVGLGKPVDGQSFEGEKGDKIVLKAIVEPDLPEIRDLVQWGTSSGATKNVTLEQTGTQNIVAWIDSCTRRTTVYTNDNASTPIYSLAIDIVNSKWAHVSTNANENESVLLRASAVDNDWFNGVKSNENQIDLARTEWRSNSGKMLIDKGETGEWKPKEKGETTVFAKFYDKSDEYSPRYEANPNLGNLPEASVKVGAYTVLVSANINSTGGNKTTKLYENNLVEGDALPINLNNVFDKTIIATATSTIKEDNNANFEGFASLEFTFLTDPPEARIRGNIVCDLSTSLSGLMQYEIYDMDFIDGAVQVSFSAGINAGVLGFSVGYTVDFGNDWSESAVALSYGFSSDNLGTKNPYDAKLLAKSSDLGDSIFGSNLTRKSAPMFFSANQTVSKSEVGDKSKAFYNGFAFAEAHATRYFAGAKAELVNTKIIVNIENVRYKK